MIKQISVRDLKPGMYVHDLDCGWLDHPFLRSRFPVGSPDDVARIVSSGVRKVYIDTDKGLDLAEAPTQQEVIEEVEAEMRVAATTHPADRRHAGDLTEEMARARAVHRDAELAVRRVMQDVRLGRALKLAPIEQAVAGITDSVLRNNGALVSLSRIKTKDDYTFHHSVSVCVLLVAFARHMDMDAETVLQAGVGGLLHDLGKMKVPDAILQKPGPLTDEELVIVRRHPRDGHDLLQTVPGISELALAVAREHHERHDGSGYPDGLAGDRVSAIGQMVAIIDVYDAITSDRVYHKALEPTDALRKVFEWSREQFNPRLVHAFLRCIGIYPVGALVLLESGRLAVVREQNSADLLRPRVRAFFDTRGRCHIQPRDLDLADPACGDAIVVHESPGRWGVDPYRFL